MIIDAVQLERLFWHQIDLGNNAMDAFDNALQDVEELTAEKLATQLKAHCKKSVCEACPFWRAGSDEVFCELHDESLPCGWEV